MDKLQKLISLCKCGVHLTVNAQRDYYATAEQHLNDLFSLECPPDIEPEVYNEMIKTDIIVELHFYPDTPIGSYSVYHYDLDSALNEALACFPENDLNQRPEAAGGRHD